MTRDGLSDSGRRATLPGPGPATSASHSIDASIGTGHLAATISRRHYADMKGTAPNLRHRAHAVGSAAVCHGDRPSYRALIGNRRAAAAAKAKVSVPPARC